MKFTLSWLREHLDFTVSLDEIVSTLNTIGLEVESVENPADTAGVPRCENRRGTPPP